MILKTTLSNIKKFRPCESGWKKLLKNINKSSVDDDPLHFKTILDSNGINGALWCLRSVEGYDKEIRLYAVWCARQVEHLDKTGVAKITNDVTEKFANDLASMDELAVARAAASDAASDAAWAAAWAAARAAASDAAWDAAWAVARAAASDAASDAARAAAWNAAWDANEVEFIKQFCE